MVSFSQKQPLSAARLSAPSTRDVQKRRRILFLDHTAVLGGGELALLHLLQHLDTTLFEPIVLLFSDGPLVAELRKSGIETQVLSLDPGVSKVSKDSLGVGSVLRVKTVARTLGFTLRLAARMRALKPDIVHTNSLKSDLIGGIAARLTRRRLIWHVRDRIADDYLPRPVVKVFQRLCRRVPHYVIANSHSTLATLLPGQGTQRSAARHARMGVVHSGIDVSSYADCADHTPQHPQQETIGSEPNAALCIGLIGRISPWKGQHIFIEAAAKVHKHFPAARFQIIGSVLFSEHDYERQIRQQVTDLNLEECVEFLGFRSDVPALIAQMDLLVHASTTGEPFGQVVAQGMAGGKPVVATNGGGVPEIVEEGVTGLLVPMNDADALANAICRILSDPERARQMGVQGRQRIKTHFAIQSTARKVECVYTTLLAKHKHPPKSGGIREESALPAAQSPGVGLRSGQEHAEELAVH